MARIAAGIGIAVAAALALAGPVVAQGETRWSVYDGADAQGLRALAQICPSLDMEVTGNFFCLSLGCWDDTALGWRVDFVGAGTVPDQIRVQFSADNIFLTPFEMSRADWGDTFGYSAPYVADRDEVIVSMLGAGRIGVMSFNPSALAAQSFSLDGAREALDFAIAQCTAPLATGTPRDGILTEVAQMCGVTLHQLGIAPDFETRADITGDGREDLIYNYGAVTCPSGASPGYCGSGGCRHAIWAARPDGGYTEVFRDTIYGLTAGWMPVLTIEAHGSACGRTGASGPCFLTFRIAPDGTLSQFD